MATRTSQPHTSTPSRRSTPCRTRSGSRSSADRSSFDYRVMPLEGLWWVPDMSQFSIERKADWDWTMMIMQPDEVDEDVFEQALAKATRKKELPAANLLRLERFSEGRAAQVLHIGPYAAEGPTIERLHAFYFRARLRACRQAPRDLSRRPAALGSREAEDHRTAARCRRKLSRRRARSRPARSLRRHRARRGGTGIRGSAGPPGWSPDRLARRRPGRAALHLCVRSARRPARSQRAASARDEQPARWWMVSCAAANAFDTAATIQRFPQTAPAAPSAHPCRLGGAGRARGMAGMRAL